jgi:acetyl-CoA carboxylase carboxyl transferase subunit beta
MKEILKRAQRPGQPREREMPENLWVRCPKCKELLYTRELEQALRVCSKCKYHFRLRAPERIALTVDKGSFVEYDSHLKSPDPLRFASGGKSYTDKLAESATTTGQPEAFMYGTATIEHIPVVIGAMEIEFIGGSMGSVVGEKVTRAIELAIGEQKPLVLFSSSGGARMQEGVVALMQMAKSVAALDKLHAAKLPYLSVMTDPCYGGVTASFAMLGDVNIAEPGAYIGFAGPRVIEQTTRQKLPPNAATAEFLQEHGMLDLVIARADMRATLARLLRLYTEYNRSWWLRERVELRVGV